MEASVQQSRRGAARRRGGGDREGGKGILQGGNPPLCSTGPATPGKVLSAPASHKHLHMPHSHLCAPKPRHSRALKDPQGPQAGQVSYPRGTLRRPALPFCPAVRTFQPAHLSDLGQMAAWNRGYLSTQAGGTWASQVSPKSRSRRSRFFAWFLDLLKWKLPTHAGVSRDLSGTGSLCSALTHEHMGSIRIS